MSEGLLAALNPGKNFTEAGTVLSVANVPQGGDDPAVIAQTLHEHRGRTGSSAPPEQTAARVVVNKQNRSFRSSAPITGCWRSCRPRSAAPRSRRRAAPSR